MAHVTSGSFRDDSAEPHGRSLVTLSFHPREPSAKRAFGSRQIGELVIEELAHLDQIAYVRFASVYRDFRDVGDFLTEMKRVLEKRARESARGKEDPE